MAPLRPDSATVAPYLKRVFTGEVKGEGYGICNYKIYDACGPGQEDQEPLLVVWLHGADMGDISPANIAGIHKRFRRRTCFFVPHNPKDCNGISFYWAVAYTKAQNKGSLGFIYGTPQEAFLEDFCNEVVLIQQTVEARDVYIMGYSMGGFGVYQIVAHAPHLFDGAVAIAGYGQGTFEETGNYKHAPQPKSSQMFQEWCAKHCPKLAQVGALLVIHAPRDVESSFRDAQRIVAEVRKANGVVQLVEVPDDMAESDAKSKRSRKSGHRYYNYTLLNESALPVLYDRLQALLDGEAPPPLPAKTCNAAAEALAFSKSYGIEQSLGLMSKAPEPQVDTRGKSSLGKRPAEQNVPRGAGNLREGRARMPQTPQGRERFAPSWATEGPESPATSPRPAVSPAKLFESPADSRLVVTF